MNCPNCGDDGEKGSGAELILRHGKTIQYMRCRECLIRFQTPIRKNIREWYATGQYRIWNKNASSRQMLLDQITRTHHQIRWIYNMFPRFMEGADVLDYGAYIGGGVIALRERGIKAYGYDIDAVAVRFAGKNLVDTDIKSDFNFAWMSHVLEHIYSPVDLLAELKEMGAEKFFIEVPTLRYTYPHVTAFDRDAMVKVALMSDLRIDALDADRREIRMLACRRN